MLFSDPDRARIETAIAAAESRTAGEIVVIVSSERARYVATALTVAALAALTLPVVAATAGWRPDRLFPDWDTIDAATTVVHAIQGFAAVQVLLFAALLALVLATRIGQWLTPRGLRQDRVHHAAIVQFKARGLSATEGRTGVLIYVAEAERIAEVIADTGIYEKVAPEHWGATIVALIDGIRAGTPADGLIAAIGLAGAVLAEHFPPVADNPNELPDRLIEI